MQARLSIGGGGPNPRLSVQPSARRRTSAIVRKVKKSTGTGPDLIAARVVAQIEFWKSRKTAPKMRAAATKSTAPMCSGFCKGLSVPRSSGQRGHVCFQTDPVLSSRVAYFVSALSRLCLDLVEEGKRIAALVWVETAGRKSSLFSRSSAGALPAPGRPARSLSQIAWWVSRPCCDCRRWLLDRRV